MDNKIICETLCFWMLCFLANEEAVKVTLATIQTGGLWLGYTRAVDALVRSRSRKPVCQVAVRIMLTSALAFGIAYLEENTWQSARHSKAGLKTKIIGRTLITHPCGSLTTRLIPNLADTACEHLDPELWCVWGQTEVFCKRHVSADAMRPPTSGRPR